MKKPMTSIECEREFDTTVFAQGNPSWYEAGEVVKNQIRWLQHVPEAELQAGEAEELVNALRRTHTILRQLTSIYLQ